MAHDPIKSIFDSVARDGVLSTNSQFNAFITRMQENGIIKDEYELSFFEKVWQEEVEVKKKWHFGRGEENVNDAKLTFDVLQKSIVKEFGGLVKGAPEIRSNLDEMETELLTLGDLIKSWCEVHQMDHIQTKQLLSMIANLEIRFSKVLSQTERLVVNQRILMEACKLRTLLNDHFITPTEAKAKRPSNPFLFQREYQSLIEGHMYRRKLRSTCPSQDIKIVKNGIVSGGLKASPDVFLLGCGDGKCFHYLGTIKQKSGSKEVDLTNVEVSKRSVRYSCAWHCYEAYRQLYFSKYFLDCFGVNYNSNEKTMFYYEHVPTSSISIGQYLATMTNRSSETVVSDDRNGGVGDGGVGLSRMMGGGACVSDSITSSFVFGEKTPLCQHWIINTLHAFTDIDNMCTFDCQVDATRDLHPPGIENFFVSNQGASLKVGGLLWKPMMAGDSMVREGNNVSSLLKQRTARLLKGWASLVEDMLSYQHNIQEDGFNDAELLGLEEVFDKGGNDTSYRESKAKGAEDVMHVSKNKNNNDKQRVSKSSETVKVYYECDIYDGGIYIQPNELFDIILQQPEPGVSWYYPVVSYRNGILCPVQVTNGSSIHPIPTEAQHHYFPQASDQSVSTSGGGGCRIRCKASSVGGSCQLIFSTNPVSKQLGETHQNLNTRNVGGSSNRLDNFHSSSHEESLKLVVPVTVYSSEVSPTLLALLRSCRSVAKDGITPLMSFNKLCSHDYFANPPDLDDVTSTFVAVSNQPSFSESKKY